MALSSAIVWEIRTTGAQTNGGGFKAGATGTDYSQQAAAQYALNPVTSVGATAVMTNANAAAVMVGNTCRVVSGTNATVGWFEIISVNVGVNITVDRNWCTGACNDGIVNVGGAFLIGGTLDNDFFTAIVPGNTVYIAQGTYTVGEAVSSAKAATAVLPITVSGYNAARNDNPTGDNRPLITTANYQSVIGSYWLNYNIRFTTTYSSGIQMNGYDIFVNCKGTNTSTSANYPAFSVSNAIFIGCEAVSRLGYAFSASSGQFYYCYAHDSKTGIVCGTGVSIDGCVADTCQKGIDTVDATRVSCTNNTIRGCLKGISGDAANANTFVNNIIADCTTGANWTTTTPDNFFDYNIWSNNGTDVSGVSKGTNDITANALLGSSVAKGTDGATGATGLVFTAASNPFAGVTTSDFLNIVETGTGATLGVYAIASVDSDGQLTLATSAAANKANIDYCIVLGTDFGLNGGSPAKNVAYDVTSQTPVTV